MRQPWTLASCQATCQSEEHEMCFGLCHAGARWMEAPQRIIHDQLCCVVCTGVPRMLAMLLSSPCVAVRCRAVCSVLHVMQYIIDCGTVVLKSILMAANQSTMHWALFNVMSTFLNPTPTQYIAGSPGTTQTPRSSHPLLCHCCWCSAPTAAMVVSTRLASCGVAS